MTITHNATGPNSTSRLKERGGQQPKRRPERHPSPQDSLLTHFLECMASLSALAH